MTTGGARHHWPRLGIDFERGRDEAIVAYVAADGAAAADGKQLVRVRVGIVVPAAPHMALP